MATHEHWTRYLPDGDEHVCSLNKAVEADNEHIANLLDRVETVQAMRLQRLRGGGVTEASGYSHDQVELAKAMVGRELAQGASRAANILYEEARFLMTSTSEVTEGLVDAIVERSQELVKLVKDLENISNSLQLLAKTPRNLQSKTA
ncbi:hypothetical protein HX798_22990 [Pseudomonas putida]|uniref:Uncharacterized protein n=1 Tax=Pseudomonas putida TaxID=303 RepID=A0A7Y8D2Z9_PSEPU|nr:hypothetical protein [Pseudomonas putida]NWC83132.1 hypothetical protein [Pseudomonas putida]